MLTICLRCSYARNPHSGIRSRHSEGPSAHDRRTECQRRLISPHYRGFFRPHPSWSPEKRGPDG